jgi:hypothetical protein
MKRNALLINIREQTPPRKTSELVVATSQVANYEGQQYLNIDLFWRGELKARYFADGITFASCINGSWKTCKLENLARICMNKGALKGGEMYYYQTCWEWNSQQDRITAREYLGSPIDMYENNINGDKYMNAIKRKEKRIAEMMDKVPTLPEGLEGWLKKTVFPGNYLLVTKKKKRTDYFCTACQTSSWRKNGWYHGEQTVCPKCGQEVTVNSRTKQIQKREPVLVLQVMDKYNWMERQLRTRCTWGADGKEIEIFEDIRAIIPRHKTWGKLWYGTYKEADEFGQDFWDKNQINKRFYESYLYPENLKETLPYGDLQYSGLDIIANRHQKINVNTFIVTYQDRKWVEYWIKAGLLRMTADLAKNYGMWGNPNYIRASESNLTRHLMINKNRLQRLKSMNGRLCTLRWLQYEEKREVQGSKKRITQESLDYLEEKHISPEECKEILKATGSVNRMVNYMKKQKISPHNLMNTWNDYLRMAENEGMDITDDIVRLPKDLKARHDELVERINARKNEKQLQEARKKYKKKDQEIMVHLPETRKYFWENEEYMIIQAGKCEELVREGQQLHHCVGASDLYMDRMAEGKSWILFLRKKEDINTPYYTIEIDMENDKIKQWYSAFDRKPDEKKIQKLLNAFTKQITKPKARILAAG